MFRNQTQTFDILGDTPTYNEYGESIEGPVSGSVEVSIINVVGSVSPSTPVADDNTYYAWVYGSLKVGQRLRLVGSDESYLVKKVNDSRRYAQLCELAKTH
ncbi:MAG: hypothetical protein ACRCXB_17910 [Aeromonadaceae bacterium]